MPRDPTDRREHNISKIVVLFKTVVNKWRECDFIFAKEGEYTALRFRKDRPPT